LLPKNGIPQFENYDKSFEDLIMSFPFVEKKNGQSFLSASFTWKKGVQQNNKFIVNIINFSIEVTSILKK